MPYLKISLKMAPGYPMNVLHPRTKTNVKQENSFPEYTKGGGLFFNSFSAIFIDIFKRLKDISKWIKDISKWIKDISKWFKDISN